MTTTRSGFEEPPHPAEMIELSTDKCRRLLRSHSVGRIALDDLRGIALFPVNYCSDGWHIAVRCDRGSRLTQAAQSEVAFEIDDISHESRTGWSVVVTGVAFEITDARDEYSELLRQLPVDTWAPGRKGCWMRIEPRVITGRMVRPAG